MAGIVKLLGMWASPYSRRVEIALKLKGVPYEYIEENLALKSPLLLKSNPVHKKVPVLIHNGKPIAESLVILEYIDEIWKGYSILPQDPYQRATARFWVKFIDEKCNPTIWKAFWRVGREQEEAVEEACGYLKLLENELKDKRFFGGESIGFVDIAANFIGFWVRTIQEAGGIEILKKEKFPKLYRWSDEFMSCSAVKENMPPRERLLALFQARFAFYYFR